MLAQRLFASTALACALALSFPAANAATLDISTASITEVQAAFSQGLTSQKLLDAYLKRIDAYDKKGPTINAVILLNPKAKAEAKKLDAEGYDWVKELATA